MCAPDLENSHRIDELLARQGARVLAFDPTGASMVPVPERFTGKAEVVEAESPLDPLAPRSHGKGVAVFDQARRTGAASGPVHLTDSDGLARLHLFNLTETDGLFLAIIGAESSDTTTSPSQDLVPRRFTLRMSATGVVLGVDEAWEKATGWASAETEGGSFMELVHPEDHERSILNWADLLDNASGSIRMRQRIRRADGSWLWVEATDLNLLADPAEECVFVEMLDISHEMAVMLALQTREALLSRVSEALPTGIMHLDSNLDVSFSNPRWYQLTGMKRDAGLESFLAQLVDDATVVDDALETALRDGVDIDVQIDFDHQPTGTKRHARLSMRPLDGKTGNDGILLALQDTTEARRIQSKLAEEARRDPLTGLLNRTGILDRLAEVLATGDDQVGLLYLDLDDFKVINDLYSHATGDEVLRAVAEKLLGVIRPDDAVGRLGGDEFLLVLRPGTRSDDAFAIAARIEREVTSLTGLWGPDLEVDASVGVAMSAIDDGLDDLVGRADVAMYRRKSDKSEQSPVPIEAPH